MSFAVVYDLLDRDAFHAALRHVRWWGAAHTERFSLGDDCLLVVFKPTGRRRRPPQEVQEAWERAAAAEVA
jgi:hypothetical protein